MVILTLPSGVGFKPPAVSADITVYFVSGLILLMSKLVAVTTSAKVEAPDKSRVLPDLIKILPPDLAAPSKVVFKVNVSVKLPVPVYAT